MPTSLCQEVREFNRACETIHALLAVGGTLVVPHLNCGQVAESGGCRKRNELIKPIVADDSRCSLSRVTSECTWMSLEKWRLERGEFFEEWAHTNRKQSV